MLINYKSSLAVFFVLVLSACSSTGLACHAPKASDASSQVPSSSSSSSSPSSSFDRQTLDELPSLQRRVYITKIIDARGSRPSDVTVSGAVLPKGDMSYAMREALKESLESNGVKFGFIGTPILHGRLIDWYAVTDKEMFKDVVSAKAVIELSLYLPDHSRAYRAIYTGEAVRRNSLFTNPRVKAALEVAMQEAIDEAASDPKLLENLQQSRV